MVEFERMRVSLSFTGAFGMNIIQQRHNVHVSGRGPTTLVFAHGFGCDQNMWRMLAPRFEQHYRVVLFDLVGAGQSDLAAYDRDRYATLQGHADDVAALVAAVAEPAGAPVVFVGHSVSAMIGLLAHIQAPERFAAHVMIGPSPSYINDGDYVGGFTRADVASLLETLEGNYLGWSQSMAPAIMGAPDQPELAVELSNSFCRTNPEIAKQFARATFLSDHRAELPRLDAPTLVIQSSDDFLAAQPVGRYVQQFIPGSVLSIVDNVGHCPHLSAPDACATAIQQFLAGLPDIHRDPTPGTAA